MSNAGSNVSKASTAVQPKQTNSAVQSFYDPFLLQSQQSLCLYPYSTAPRSPVTLFQESSSFSVPMQKCPQVFTFSPQGAAMSWQGAYGGASAQEVVLTPTTLPQNLINPGVIAAGTPEFIHPRNTNLPQWLMSPPVVENDPAVSYLPITTASVTLTSSVSKTLMTPDDFKLPPDKSESDCATEHKHITQPDCDTADFQCHSTPIVAEPHADDAYFPLECVKNKVDHIPELDSGIDTPDSSKQCSHLCGFDDQLEKLFLLCKRCENCDEFKHKLHDRCSHCVCCMFITAMLFTGFSHQSLDHSVLLRKLGMNLTSDSTSNSGTDKQNMFPIGVFWDIENCAVPNGKSASAIANKIREKFFNDHAEAEFMAVCDINKESKHVIQDLNNAQVNVIHVNATAKNAADDKLRQSIRRYAQAHSAPATVILITGDCNFTSEVSDLRHRHKYFVVLIHPLASSDSLVQAANTAVSYEEFVSDLPTVYPCREVIGASSETHLFVTNLPANIDINLIRNKLKQLSENCGGKVIKVHPPTATIKFSNEDLARRSLKRLNGETVMGSKIIVMPKTSDLSAHSKHFTPRNRGNQVYHDSRQRATPTRPRKYDGHNTEQIRNPHIYKDANGVQLTISNIDSKLGVKAIQEAVWDMITEHTSIWKLQIRPHNRFTVMCDVTVPNVNAASCVLQHLHRRKIGSKRVLVTITQRQNEDVANLKKELLPILKEFGSEGIHSQKLMALYSQSFHRKIKFSTLHQLQDFLALDERPDGVYVVLNRTLDRPSYSLCQMHFRPERSAPNGYLKIDIGLREFSAKLHALLHSHNGIVHLHGFEQCYQAEFGIFPYPQDMDGGVYLEHQISYVPGVQILEDGTKSIVWSQPHSDAGSDAASDISTSSRSKTSNAVSFSREIVELLKAHPYCCIPAVDFRAAYQTRFGHALRIGAFSDVVELLSTISHVVQVMGVSPNQLVTLTHRSQVKRFTHEIIKILKASPDKAILMAQLPDMYLKTYGRAWNLRDYGVSVLSDILDDIPDGNICVSGTGDNIVLSLPSRERTTEELERANQFSRELIEILKSRHRCRMSFTEFVPAYHRQFGRQCKLSNYGFNKLVDLFESLPHVVKVVDGTEKFLQLTDDEQLKVLTSQIIGLLRHADGESVQMPLARLQPSFSHKYGFPLVPHYYGCDSIESLGRRLSHAVKIVHDFDGTLLIKQAERKPIRLLCAQLLVLLLDLNVDQAEMEQLHQAYRDRYHEEITPGEYGFLSLLDVLKKAISAVAKFETNDSETVISLKPIYQRAKRIRSILLQHGGSMSLGEFNRAYRAHYGEALDAERHGFRSGEAMLRALSMILMVKGFGIKKTVVLRNHMQHGPLSTSVTVTSEIHLSKQTHSADAPPSGISKPPPLQEIISNCASPRKAQKLDVPFSPSLNTVRRDDSYRPYQPIAKCHAATRREVSPHGFSAPAARDFPAAESRGAVGSDPFYVFEPSAEQYHQYQCEAGRGDYVTSQSGQYFQFKEGSYQSPLTSYAPFAGGGDLKVKSCTPLQDIFQRSSDSQPGRRRFSLSVITLPTGTTSISSTPSPDSALSTDEDSKVSSDESRLLEQSKQAATASPLHLVTAFPAPSTL